MFASPRFFGRGLGRELFFQQDLLCIGSSLGIRNLLNQLDALPDFFVKSRSTAAATGSYSSTGAAVKVTAGAQAMFSATGDCSA